MEGEDPAWWADYVRRVTERFNALGLKKDEGVETMPVMACEKDGKPGWKYGEAGTCYTYTPGNKESSDRAKQKAHVQGAAIRANMTPREKVAEGLAERKS